MKWVRLVNNGLLLTALFLGFWLPLLFLGGEAVAVEVRVVSDSADPLWTVIDANGNPLGPPQNVCLTTAPSSNCPVATMHYGYPWPIWSANLSSIPGAKWIWAPNINGTTLGAANAEFTFEHMFYMCGTPQGGTVSVAADDVAEVFLNGSSVPVLTASDFTALKTASIPATSFSKGENFIKIKARNRYIESCHPDNYQCNPAGVVFGASFSDSLGVLPTCAGKNGAVFTAGQLESLPCNAGETGSNFRICTCFGIWWSLPGTCTKPQVTCLGTGGKPYGVNTSETLPCPPPKTGTASRTCEANGTWRATDFSQCVAPAVTCTGMDGKAYAVNTSETLPCPAPKTGAASHTCQASGKWSATDYGRCVLPMLNRGDLCESREQGEIGRCPSGTECRAQTTKKGSVPWWCPLVLWAPFECRDSGENLVSTDKYCEPL